MPDPLIDRFLRECSGLSLDVYSANHYAYRLTACADGDGAHIIIRDASGRLVGFRTFALPDARIVRVNPGQAVPGPRVVAA